MTPIVRILWGAASTTLATSSPFVTRHRIIRSAHVKVTSPGVYGCGYISVFAIQLWNYFNR